MFNFQTQNTDLKESSSNDSDISIGQFTTKSQTNSFSESLVSGVMVSLDIFTILVAGVLVYVIRLGWDQSYSIYCFSSIFVAFLVAVSFNATGLYRFDVLAKPVRFSGKLLLVYTLVFSGYLALIFALQVSENISRIWFFSWFISTSILILVQRYIWSFVLKKLVKSKKYVRNIVLVGAGEQAELFLKQLDNTHEPWNQVIGIFDDRTDRVGPALHGCKILGTVNDILDYARSNQVDDIVITLPWNANDRLREIIDTLMELPINIRLCADLIGFSYPQKNGNTIGKIAMLDLVHKPVSGLDYILKQFEDKLLTMVFIILLAPLMGCIAVFIKLQSPGPVIFRQKRHGYNNTEFHVYKFRSMYESSAGNCGSEQTQKDDPRSTPIGKYLRKFSLDELPQLFNVIQGTMSLVGPRPHPVPLNEKYAPIVERYLARHKVKPGITGWAQVNGLRGPVWLSDVMQARIEHDIYYIDNWSLGLDIKIMFLTVFGNMTNENTY